MIIRDFSSALTQLYQGFSALLLTGARQTGKTTLLKHLFGKTHQYVLLENPDTRALAINDPRAFLKKYATRPVIIEEFQYAPELLNYLQGYIDENREQKGFFILTGSQNFSMMKQVSQSLAGRIGIASLYGLSAAEILQSGNLKQQWKNLASREAIAHLIFRGSYPELWNQQLKESDPFINLWMSSYVQTFLERDLRQLAQVGDLNTFEKFLRLSALRTAQVLNVSELASDIGVSPTTCQHWLSLLERAMIIRFVEPMMVNISSRIKKAKKLYFLDTGLASYLMGFRDEQAILQSPQFGQLFETLVYSNFIKQYSAQGLVPSHYYLQTRSKIGVDLIIEQNQQIKLCEIKCRETFRNDLCKQLVATSKELESKYRITSCDLLMLAQPEDQALTTISGCPIQIRNWAHV